MHSKIALLVSMIFSFHAASYENEDIWSGNFDLGLNFTKNNQSIFQFNNIFLVKYKISNYKITVSNNMSFISKNGDDDLLNKGYKNLKAEFILKRWQIGGDFNHLYDISSNIKNRYSTGLGVSFNTVNNESGKLIFGISAQREKEFQINNEIILESRLSNSLDFVKKINSNMKLTIFNKYVPNIEDFSDFRWHTIFSIRLKLATQFALNINALYNYDSNPSKGIPEIDYQLINSISYIF